MPDVREEVVNVALSDLLEERGLLSVPETIRKAVLTKGRKLPDITVAYLLGVRIVVEGRFDSTSAHASLLKDAKRRVEDGISPVCLAVLYPAEIRSTTSFSKLKNKLEKSTLKMRVISEGSEGEWGDASINDIADALRRAYELIVKDDVVVRCVEDLEHAIEVSSDVFVHTKSLSPRFRVALGISPVENKKPDEEEE
jgi:hypothetical protein